MTTHQINSDQIDVDQLAPDPRPGDAFPAPTGAGTVTTGTVTLSGHTLDAVTELLGLCEEFLRTAGPETLAELRTYLRGQCPPAGPGWLIDMLGFNHLHLRRTAEPTKEAGR